MCRDGSTGSKTGCISAFAYARREYFSAFICPCACGSLLVGSVWASKNVCVCMHIHKLHKLHLHVSLHVCCVFECVCVCKGMDH